MAQLEHTDGIMPTIASASKDSIRGHSPQSIVWTEVPTCIGTHAGAGTQEDGEVLVAEPDTKIERPSFWRVVLLNDDYTPMDFVVNVLEHIFRKDHETAIELMMAVHNKGAAVCGVYTRDVAETKVDQVIEYARINDYPLQCTVEKDA